MGMLLLTALLGGCAAGLLGRKKGGTAPVDAVSEPAGLAAQVNASATATEVQTYTLPPPNAPLDGRNAVVAYLWDVEIQADEGQHTEICRALNDMMTLSAAELKQARYADYEGNVGQWNILQMLHAHFVPALPVGLDGFWNDIEKPQSREIVRLTLKDLEDFCAGKGFEIVAPQEPQAEQPFKSW